MNTKAAIGIIVAILILVAAFFVLNRPQTPAAFTNNTASTTSASTTPSPVPAVPASAINTAQPPAPKPTGPTIVILKKAAIDASSLVTTSTRPTITGTASVSAVAIVLDNPEGVGIAGSSNIPVKDGHWSFTPPQTLSPGTYTLHLIGGEKIIEESLFIKAN